MDQLEPLQVPRRIKANFPARARRLDQSKPIVVAQRLWMHVYDASRYADDVARFVHRRRVHRAPQAVASNDSINFDSHVVNFGRSMAESRAAAAGRCFARSI